MNEFMDEGEVKANLEEVTELQDKTVQYEGN